MRLKYLKYDVRNGLRKVKTRTAVVLSTIALTFSSGLGISLGLLNNAGATSPGWNLNGVYTLDFLLNGSPTVYSHDATISGQNSSGNFLISGGNPAGGTHVYQWNGTGSVNGNAVSFAVDYTASADAIGDHMDMTGTIASNGTLSGTWSDDYQGGNRSGTWVSSNGAAQMTSTVVVTNSNSHGWVKTEASYPAGGVVGTIGYVPATGADGTGAAQFTTTEDSSYTRLKKDINAPLSSINTLTYMTKQISAPADASAIADVNLRLYVDTDNNGTVDDVLVYEPYYNNGVQTVVPNTWQTWDGAAGFWWSNNELTYNGHTTVGAGGYDTNFHLSDVLHDFPGASVVSVGLGTGTSNFPWVVQADDLVVNNITYNFENETAVKPVVTDKDQCKGNGWMNVVAKDKSAFKNQGACVSYVASNGKSQH